MPQQRGSYLFAERATVHDVVEAQRRNVARFVDEVDPKELLARPIEEIEAEIVHRLRIDMPVLQRDKTVSLRVEEIEIDVSRDPMRMIVPRRGPYLVKGSLVRIAIPFTGEAVLFKYGTVSAPYNVPVPGEVEDDHVVLSYQAEHPDGQKIKADFDQRAAQIEEKLNMGRGRTDEWNREVVNLVRARLSERRKKLEQASSFSLGFPAAPPRPVKPEVVQPGGKGKPAQKAYDLFLSHASEDKDAIARPLYEALVAAGASVWYDEAVLKLGDGLRRKLMRGSRAAGTGSSSSVQRFFNVLIRPKCATGSIVPGHWNERGVRPLRIGLFRIQGVVRYAQTSTGNRCDRGFFSVSYFGFFTIHRNWTGRRPGG